MRILIVDDDKALRDSLKAGLEAECFVVDTAEDGEKGEYLAKINDYDLVILDCIMPKKNGKQVCASIRKRKKDLPILILSVQSEVPTKVDLLDIGADDYMTKPFSIDELLARIRAIFRRPKVVAAPVYQVGNLTLDVDRQEVKRGGKSIYLTRKEFALLEYLMKNQGKVLSRARIFEHVWDMNADPFSNTIESHILTLRKKIDTRGRSSLIHTIPGRGYKVAQND